MANLLIQAGADVNASNDLGVTPLMLACTNGSGTIVKALLRSGADT
jgi:ankyrin repeat protein